MHHIRFPLRLSPYTALPQAHRSLLVRRGTEETVRGVELEGEIWHTQKFRHGAPMIRPLKTWWLHPCLWLYKHAINSSESLTCGDEPIDRLRCRCRHSLVLGTCTQIHKHVQLGNVARHGLTDPIISFLPLVCSIAKIMAEQEFAHRTQQL